jgi:CDP-ribitol ribitolphosphotransferase / teichoic acid ribitol-phosphate polymerase
MLKTINRILFFLIRQLVPRFIRPDKQKIIFLKENNSGCNANSLYRLLKDCEHPFKLELVSNKDFDDNRLSQYFLKIKKLSEAKLIISTHSPIILPSRKSFDLWHSFFLKVTGAMENKGDKFRLKSNWQKTDALISYSTFYTTVMNACFLTDPDKFKVCGVPRNDIMLRSNGRKNLEKIFKRKSTGKKFIFFVPTFRMGYGQEQGAKNFSNIFGFPDFDSDKFNTFLKENNFEFIYKLHPNEESFADRYLNKIDSQYSSSLTDQLLADNEIDLYDTISGYDVLITDYSGIYYDYLLLDRPCLFTPVDLESYADNRGFLYEPYDEWTPGPKAYNQDQLQNELLKCLYDDSYYSRERERLKKIIHRHHDDNSHKRILEEIKKLI